MMMRGTLTDRLEALIGLDVIDASNRAHRIEALIDTGFNGALSLPGQLINALGLTRVGVSEGTLANGTTADFETYLGHIIWNDSRRFVMVVQSDGGNLLGMELLENLRLTMDVVRRGTFTIEPIH